MLEGNGQIFSPREPSCPDQHIAVPLPDPQLIEVRRRVVSPRAVGQGQ